MENNRVIFLVILSLFYPNSFHQGNFEDNFAIFPNADLNLHPKQNIGQIIPYYETAYQTLTCSAIYSKNWFVSGQYRKFREETTPLMANDASSENIMLIIKKCLSSKHFFQTINKIPGLFLSRIVSKYVNIRY